MSRSASRAARRPARRRLLPRAGALAAVGLMAVTGCALEPGVAVTVDGATVPDGDVDAYAAALCDVVRPNLEQPVALLSLKAAVIQALVDQQVAQGVAERYDVGPGAEFGDLLRQNAQQVTGVSSDVRDDYLEVFRAANYAQAIYSAAAQAELERTGGDPADEAAIAQLVSQIGTLARRDADIEIDPRYGLAYVDGSLTPDTGASVPASDTALAATSVISAEPDPSYAETLPASQVCAAG